MKPSIGRIVHFVQYKPESYWVKDQPKPTVHLPAIIVSIWSDTCVNLQVFTDGTNSETGPNSNPASVKWVTSVALDEGESPNAYTWHWPEQV